MECITNSARWQIIAFPIAILSINVLALFRPMFLEVGNRKQSAFASHEDMAVLTGRENHESSFQMGNIDTVADIDGVDRDDTSMSRLVNFGGMGSTRIPSLRVFDDEHHEKYYQEQLSAISGRDRTSHQTLSYR